MLRQGDSIAQSRMRQFIRAFGEATFDGTVTGGRAFGGNFDRMVIAYCLTRNALARDNPSAEPVRIAIHALAHGFARPFETMRRQALALVASGYAAVGPGGVVLSPATLAGLGHDPLCDHLHDCFVRMVEHLGDIPDLPPTARDVVYTSATATIAMIDLILTQFEFGAHDRLKPNIGVVMFAIVIGNIRAIYLSQALSDTFLGPAQPPPDQLRQPLTNTQLSCATGIPLSTVKRATRQLLDRDLIERVGGGFIVPVRTLMREPHLQVSRILTARTLHHLHQVARKGFDFGAVASHYRGDPPSLVGFG